MMIPIRMIDNAYQEPHVGLEPTTYRLQGGCSTTELKWHTGLKGLEPSTSCVTGRRSNRLSYNPLREEPFQVPWSD